MIATLPGIALVIVGFVWAAAPVTKMSAEQLLTRLAELQTVDSGDSFVAAELASVVLTTRLPAEALDVLKRPELGPMTLGPITLQSLQGLVETSASLEGARESLITLDAPPGDSIRKTMLDRMSSFANNYVHGLPRFVCAETTRYFTSGHLSKHGKTVSVEDKHPADWHLDQKITEDVRYLDGAEEYRTKSIDDQPSNMVLNEVRKSYSRGEFGTILSETFDPTIEARFDWDHWENVQGKRMGVWTFRVSRDHSQYSVCCISMGSVTIRGVRREQRKTWISAYRGLIYADPETGVIRRLVYQTVDVPADYDLDDSRTLLEFENVKLKTSQVWLPRHALHYTRQQNFRTKSQIDFSDYHSFEADSAIEFPTEETSPKK